ncbi:hypothetical protein BsWGS_20506 [Bradybaena similaris]
MTKSYIWWTDDPWAALLALAAIIIVVSIVSIIVVFYTYSRYSKFSQRIFADSLKHPPGVGPRTVSREYETQSLNIYVPHDDALSDVTDSKMAVAESSMEFISYKDQRSMPADIFTTSHAR